MSARRQDMFPGLTFGRWVLARLYVFQWGVRLYLRSICLIIVRACVIFPPACGAFFHQS